MYGLIRTAFGCIVFALCFFLMKKKNISKKMNIIISLAIALVVCTGSYFLPVENSVLTFPTAEKAFAHVNSEKAVLVAEGEKSALVVGEESENEHTLLIVPKSDEGWKIGRGIDTKLEKQLLDGDFVINLYKHRRCGDYYISILYTGSGELEISDSCNSAFYAPENTGDRGSEFRLANISDYDDSYRININGMELQLD